MLTRGLRLGGELWASCPAVWEVMEQKDSLTFSLSSFHYCLLPLTVQAGAPFRASTGGVWAPVAEENTAPPQQPAPHLLAEVPVLVIGCPRQRILK